MSLLEKGDYEQRTYPRPALVTAILKIGGKRTGGGQAEMGSGVEENKAEEVHA